MTDKKQSKLKNSFAPISFEGKKDQPILNEDMGGVVGGKLKELIDLYHRVTV